MGAYTFSAYTFCFTPPFPSYVFKVGKKKRISIVVVVKSAPVPLCSHHLREMRLLVIVVLSERVLEVFLQNSSQLKKEGISKNVKVKAVTI